MEVNESNNRTASSSVKADEEEEEDGDGVVGWGNLTPLKYDGSGCVPGVRGGESREEVGEMSGCESRLGRHRGQVSGQ